MEFSLTKRSSNKALKLLGYQKAAEAVIGFEKGSRIIGLTKGQFSLLHLITELLKKTGPAELIISTWSAGVYESSALCEMVETGLILDILIITDRSYATRQKQYAITIEQAFGKARIRTTNTHAKFVLIKNDEWSICIRSSMNLNENKRCENFDIDDDIDIFKFYKDFSNEILDVMPEGFVDSRTIVDPAFDKLMNGALFQKKESKKNGFQIVGKNGVIKKGEL